MANDRRGAVVGPLTFHDDFRNPIVDVTREANTVEHETINDGYVVQFIGRKPPSITIEGVIYDAQVEAADSLIGQGPIPVKTERWTGIGIPQSVSTPFRREVDPGTGQWTYDITIDMIGVVDYIPSGGATNLPMLTEDIDTDEDFDVSTIEPGMVNP